MSFVDYYRQIFEGWKKLSKILCPIRKNSLAVVSREDASQMKGNLVALDIGVATVSSGPSQVLYDCIKFVHLYAFFCFLCL